MVYSFIVIQHLFLNVPESLMHIIFNSLKCNFYCSPWHAEYRLTKTKRLYDCHRDSAILFQLVYSSHNYHKTEGRITIVHSFPKRIFLFRILAHSLFGQKNFLK